MHAFTLDQLEDAARQVHAVLPPTPQYAWPLLCARVGAEVWVKHENHTPLGAFKVRGGVVYMAALKQTQPGLAGVIAATRGNHGQSIAFAARRVGPDRDDRCAARQQRREERGDARASAPS